MPNEVTDLLDALYDGAMSIDEVARRFRERAWPRRQVAEPGSYLEMAAAERETQARKAWLTATDLPAVPERKLVDLRAE